MTKIIGFIVCCYLLLMQGCATVLQIRGEGLALFGGVRLDFLGVVFGVVGGISELSIQAVGLGLICLIDLPLSLALDLLLFFPSLLFGGTYLKLM